MRSREGRRVADVVHQGSAARRAECVSRTKDCAQNPGLHPTGVGEHVHAGG